MTRVYQKLFPLITAYVLISFLSLRYTCFALFAFLAMVVRNTLLTTCYQLTHFITHLFLASTACNHLLRNITMDIFGKNSQCTQILALIGYDIFPIVLILSNNGNKWKQPSEELQAISGRLVWRKSNESILNEANDSKNDKTNSF